MTKSRQPAPKLIQPVPISAATGAVSFIRGTPGAGGRACGHARIVASGAQAMAVQLGEIIVTSRDDPAWTVFFPAISAIVLNEDDPGKHCAGLAHAYGIPSISATAIATTLIRDGDLLEVDGSAGVVFIIIPD